MLYKGRRWSSAAVVAAEILIHVLTQYTRIYLNALIQCFNTATDNGGIVIQGGRGSVLYYYDVIPPYSIVFYKHQSAMAAGAPIFSGFSCMHLNFLYIELNL